MQASDGTTLEFNTPLASGGNGADKISDGDGSSGWSAAIGAEQHIILPEEALASQPHLFHVSLFERHFVASLGRFRISATSSSKSQSPIVWAPRSKICWPKKMPQEEEMDQLKSTYLEKLFLYGQDNRHLCTCQMDMG